MCHQKEEDKAFCQELFAATFKTGENIEYNSHAIWDIKIGTKRATIAYDSRLK